MLATDYTKLWRAVAFFMPPEATERQRWDALWNSRYDVAHLYSYLDDSHIDTALRAISAEVNKRPHPRACESKYHDRPVVADALVKFHDEPGKLYYCCRDHADQAADFGEGTIIQDNIDWG